MLNQFNATLELFSEHSLLTYRQIPAPADREPSAAVRDGIKEVKKILRKKCAEYGARCDFGYLIPDTAITTIRGLCREIRPDWENDFSVSVLKVRENPN